MRQKFIIALVLLLSVVAPFAALADSFKINPVNLGPGKSGTLSFTLTNARDLYGFQAELTLPAGVTAATTTDGKLDITLSERAAGGKENYIIDSNTLSDGSLIMGVVSSTHTSFTGNDGVLLTLKVNAAESYAGGTAEMKNIYFIDADDKDVKFDATSTTLGVAATEITFNRTTLQLRVGGATTLKPNLTPAVVSDTVKWTSSKPAVATVDNKGNVKALAIGQAVITATCGAVNATCQLTVVATPVEKINLSSTALTLEKGKSSALTATVLPDSATNKTVKWTSSKATVATVDANGNVTAVDGGAAVITATSESNPDIKATCTVTVTVPVTGLNVLDEDKNPLQDGAVISIDTGSSHDLTAVVLPEGATDKTVTWTSSDGTVATVNSQGLIKAIKAGEATITASIAGYSFTVKVVVTDPVVAITGITLDPTTADMKTGSTLTLKATVTPSDATNKSVSWASGNKEFATVTKGENNTCVVKALKAGKVTVTASANGIEASCEITITDIDVTEVKLDATEKSVVKGETFKLTATVNPENATHPEVTWESTNEKVATVDEEGNVTAVGGGTAGIKATAGTVTAVCTVTVTVPVTGLQVLGEELDEDHNHIALETGTTLNLHTGDTYDLTAVVLPADATDTTVTWTTTDAEVATVDEDGKIETHKAGEATIKAEIAGFSFEVKVVVTDPIVPITGIKLNRTELEMTVGDDFTLKATFDPADATSQEVTWKSSDPSVATVSKTGVVTALKAGEVTITATANKISATCKITVKDPVPDVESITLDKEEANMVVGETLTLEATVNTEETGVTVSWTSSDPSVATVDENGEVTAVAVGKATITATAGDKSATCEITVAPTSGIAQYGIGAGEQVKVYDMNGLQVSDSTADLPRGIYIIRRGEEVRKICVK